MPGSDHKRRRLELCSVERGERCKHGEERVQWYVLDRQEEAARIRSRRRVRVSLLRWWWETKCDITHKLELDRARFEKGEDRLATGDFEEGEEVVEHEKGSFVVDLTCIINRGVIFLSADGHIQALLSDDETYEAA
jgi:hypothetical protein